MGPHGTAPCRNGTIRRAALAFMDRPGRMGRRHAIREGEEHARIARSHRPIGRGGHRGDTPAGRTGRGQGARRSQHAQPASACRIQPDVRTARRRHRLRPGVQRSARRPAQRALLRWGPRSSSRGTRSVVGRRIYDADGNLLKRHFREDFVGTFTNPSSGVTVDWVTHATNIHVLSVPGDLASGISSRRWPVDPDHRIRRRDGPDRCRSVGVRRGDRRHPRVPRSASLRRLLRRGDVEALQPLCDALA